MTSVSGQGTTSDHHPVRARPRHRRRRAGRQFGDRRDRAPAAAGDADAAVVPQGQPGRLRRSSSSRSPPTMLPISTVNEYAETYLAQRISTISGVAQVQVFGQQKYAVRVQVDPERARRARHRHQRGAAGGRAAPTSTCPPARSTARTGCSRCRRTASSTTRTAFRPVIVTYRNGTPVRLERARPRHRQRADRQGGGLVQGQARHRARDPAPARHQHHRGGGRGEEAAAHVPRRSARPASTSTCSTTAP